MRNLALIVAMFIIAETTVIGQEIRVRVAMQPAPHYVHDPVMIQFSVEGFEEGIDPECRLENAMPGIAGKVVAINPSVFSQVIQRNGRLFRSTSVTYQIHYEIQADKPGDYVVGPFILQQGDRQSRVESLNMSFLNIPLDPAMRVRIVMTDRPVYLQQRVPVSVEWWYAGDFENVLDLAIRCDLFDRFNFGKDRVPSERESRLVIDTVKGRIELYAGAREEMVNGKRFTVLYAKRTLIPDEIGIFNVGAITATLQQAKEWSGNNRSRSTRGFGGLLFQDLLGKSRQPIRTELSQAQGKAKVIEIKKLPDTGCPNSFSGAVGSGFSMEVSADRTVCRVGDPIRLDIVIRGDGNLADTSLPNLGIDDGLNPDQFQFSNEDVPGVMTDGGKHFQVSFRVRDPGVKEIPGLPLSWFDPVRERYQTHHSRPIALQVMDASVVSANDVVRPSSESSSPPETARGSEPRGQAKLTPPGTADLAIETDIDVLLQNSRSSELSPVIRIPGYACGVGVILVGWVLRRRRDRDPETVLRDRRTQEWLRQVDFLLNRNDGDSSEELAKVMRSLMPDTPPGLHEEMEQVIATCDSITYAPNSTNHEGYDLSFHQNVRSLVDRIRKYSKGSQTELLVTADGESV